MGFVEDFEQPDAVLIQRQPVPDALDAHPVGFAGPHGPDIACESHVQPRVPWQGLGDEELLAPRADAGVVVGALAGVAQDQVRLDDRLAVPADAEALDRRDVRLDPAVPEGVGEDDGLLGVARLVRRFVDLIGDLPLLVEHGVTALLPGRIGRRRLPWVKMFAHRHTPALLCVGRRIQVARGNCLEITASIHRRNALSDSAAGPRANPALYKMISPLAIIPLAHESHPQLLHHRPSCP